MAYVLREIAEIGEMEEAAPSARNLVPPAVLAGLSRRSDLRGAVRLAEHAGCIGATGVLVWLALPFWYLLLPAMTLHGFTIVTLFAPMHECVHRTAFASRAANEIVAWIAGVLGFYNATFYWHFHSWHHRYTQDPARDPELMFPKAASRLEYLREISSFNFWLRRAIDYPRLALGLVRNLPFVPESARRGIALSMSAQLLIYLAAAAVSVPLGFREVLYFWFLPVLLAQPLLRALLVAEHTGCSQDRNGLTNTRTTLASFPIRLLMWNMPYHAEHHLYPTIPFHCLPALHREVRAALRHLAPGYVAVNREIIEGLSRTAPPRGQSL
jgi:fatty acid desaturase